MSKTIYLITDRYECAEFYAIYGQYNTLEEANKAWPKEVKAFKKYGPDDCHCFRLTMHELDDDTYNELQTHLEKYKADDDYSYSKDFTSFREDLMETASELKFTDGLD